MTERAALVIERVPNSRSPLCELFRESGILIVINAVSPRNAHKCLNTIALNALYVEVAVGDESGVRRLPVLDHGEGARCRRTRFPCQTLFPRIATASELENTRRPARLHRGGRLLRS